VRHEAVLNRALEHALARVEHDPQNIVLLGIEPEEPDAELGYILPHADTSGCPSVKRFVEKPTQLEAHTLIQKGALWNTFILVAQGSALLRLFEYRSPETVLDMRAVLRHPPASIDYSLHACSVYATLPEIDFSRHICQGQEHALRVLPVPACGWSDLGTPQRVTAALRQLTPAAEPSLQRSAMAWTSHLNLAAQAAL
jgi:mannose-1-phosphate guanylyltransferase